MSAAFTLNPVRGFSLPSLAEILRRNNRPAAATRLQPVSSGLSCGDIADAASRATVRSGLRVSPAALRKLYP